MGEITVVLESSMDNVFIQLIKWLGISVFAYVGTFLILRLIKVPKGICNFIAVIVFAIVIYKSLFDVYIPGIMSNL
ncbi:hypothetical protein J22TS1_09160 [Siminovitchia terrae]|uniref:hypothetical protein n=1 Tax=Siminovitchia terrae TaxID=1914933 RepID=UPI001B21F00D|nr:hypothetical protein [Siminovitchia terrae]GIN89865.1 hypothetical protein J22TS1_09160 [Siminovitchia terrae]